MVAGSSPRSGPWVALAVAIGLPLLAFLLTGDRNLNLADEGYLWYGVQRTVAGAVPLRDFQAYDPGRYHWCALFAPFLGTGILAVRVAVAVFQGLGLLCGLLVARRLVAHPAWMLFFGVVLELWMFPRHKLFEPATALMVTWVAVRLLERPSLGRHLAAGIAVGLAGYMGRNLGLYAGLATGALVVLIAWKRPAPGRARRAAAWAGGVLLGHAPIWIMLVFVPGYGAGLGESLRVIAKEGANLPRPWPWPWRVGREVPATLDAWVESVAFLLPLLAVLPLLVLVLRTCGERLAARAALVAPALVGLFFLHHASVRSDAPHLAQCIHPLLLAMFALPVLLEPETLQPVRRALTGVVWSTLALVTLAMAWTSNPTLTVGFGKTFVTQRVGGETLRLLPPQAAYLAAVERVVAERVGDGALFIAPNRPTLYALLGKTAPTWWIYYFWRATDEEQRVTIASLAEHGVDWALVIEAPSDDKAELLFRNTNPLVWQHFRDAWTLERTPALPPDHLLFHRR